MRSGNRAVEEAKQNEKKLLSNALIAARVLIVV